MIVLVDTSVWIRFLANRAPYAAELDGHARSFWPSTRRCTRRRSSRTATWPRLATLANEPGTSTNRIRGLPRVSDQMRVVRECENLV